MARRVRLALGVVGIVAGIAGRANAQGVVSGQMPQDVARVGVGLTQNVIRGIVEAIQDAARAARRVTVIDGHEISNAVRDAWRGVAHGGASAWIGEQSGTLRAVQTDRETRTLQLGADGQLRLENISGDITVAAGNGRDTTIEIVRHSHGRTDADAKLGLDHVRVDVAERGGRATVLETYSKDPRSLYNVDVEYHVTTPAGTAVSTHTFSGHVAVTGVHGELSINTVSGNVDISDAGAVAEARTISGNVTVVGVQTDGAVVAGTTSGIVRVSHIRAHQVSLDSIADNITAADVTCDAATLHSFTGNLDFSGTLAPHGRYEFQTQAGNVHLGVDGRVGFEFDAKTFGGSIQTDIPLQMIGTIPRGIRQTLHGTSGDASANMSVTTFSGSIVLGKKP